VARSLILVVVDQQHRDLPSAALISYFLKNKGHDVILLKLPKAQAVVAQIKPDWIIVPKGHNYVDYLGTDIRQFSKIIVLPTEGNLQTHRKRLPFPKPIDVCYFWNATELAASTGFPGLSDSMKHIIGNPRLDFLHPRNRVLSAPNDVIRKRLRLNREQPTLTVTTRLVIANYSESDAREQRQYLVGQGAAERWDDDYLRDQHQKQIIEDMIKLVLVNYPYINCVIKPHPNENINYWINLKKQHPTLRLALGETIQDVLFVSDFNISNISCTTVAEARAVGVRSCEVITEWGKGEQRRDDEKRLPEYVIKNSQDIIPICEYLITSEPEKLTSIRNKATIDILPYLEKYNGVFDGRCCLRYAESIHQIVSSEEMTVRRALFGTIIRRKVFHARYKLSMIQVHIESMFKNMLNLDQQMSWVWKRIDSRGKYESRIVMGAETLWYRRFKKHTIDFSVNEET